MAVGDWDNAVTALAPLLWWKLDETSGTTVADASGNGRVGAYGTAAGSSTQVLATRGLPSLVANSAGSSISLPGGVQAEIDIALPSGDATLGATGTLAFSFRHASEISNVMVQRGTLGGEISVYGNSVSGDIGTLWVQYDNGTASVSSINTGVLKDQLSDDRPHLIVVTWGSTGVRVYFDGVEVGSNATPAQAATATEQSWFIGRGAGRYDDFVVFGTELSAAQVTDLREAWGWGVEFTGSGTLTAAFGAMHQAFDVNLSGSGSLSTVLGRMDKTAVANFAGEGSLRAIGRRIPVPELVLEILDPTLRRAPTAVTVVVANGWALRELDFFIDGYLVWTGETNRDGFLRATSINVPEHSVMGAAGSHTLRVEQKGASSDSKTFTLERDPQPQPIAIGPDAQAVDVPGAVRPNGTRAWILQDLHPVEYGGIGSYIMPYSPSQMSNPHLEKTFTVHHSTAPQDEEGRGGQFHVMQGGTVPKEWTFEGYCPSKEMHNAMERYKNLNRRFYIIDHRKRAWKVVITNIEWTARLHQIFNDTPTNWGHDYVVTATVLDQGWVNPA